MTAASDSPVKQALGEIRRLRAKLAEVEASAREPIAIVGMAMRLPGGIRDAGGFAEFLWSGRDAITEIPRDRWPLDAYFSQDPDEPAKMTTRYGAFLDQVYDFDAAFFGISPREAATMDPQQRLILEVGWHAFEDAQLPPAVLAGASAGVYLGIANNDYGRALFAHQELIDAYFATGNAYSVAAGRLSYQFGLQGPSLAIDTACSSSLVAIHLACQALRSREVDFAIAGGVNLILSPEMNINFSKARMMAADGRCKTFDAAADGYVRGEGCALVVLRRLSDAQANGDRIHAVIRGSAINQDGRSGGLTAPNGPAQEAVIRSALANANVTARDVGYIEAHGTGTSLGDPIEAGALGAVFAQGREAPLWIGSLKTNLGHLEAAAGVSGLIKAVLCLQRPTLPPHLNFAQGNPLIDWEQLKLAVPTSPQPWPPGPERRLAGVSSFGFSGTNAHVVLEEAPPAGAPPTGVAAARPRHILALSAKEGAALHDLASRYAERLGSDTEAANICFSANTGRAHLGRRLAVVGGSAEEMQAALRAFCEQAPHPCLAVSEESVQRPRVAFLFTGQGSQYVGMGKALYETSAVFKQAIEDCAAAFDPLLDRRLLEILFHDEAIHETRFAQPAIFSLQVALTRLWRSWGVEPMAALGHSLGEYAAAWAAGVFTLDEAARLIAERGRLMQALPSDGAMATVPAGQSVVTAEIARSGGQLEIAAYNGPEHFVLAGPTAAVERAIANLQSSGVDAKRLRVSYAAHSRLVEPALPAFARLVETVAFKSPRIILVANTSGRAAEAGEMSSPRYWLDQIREPVQFHQAMQTLASREITHFVEIGPHPVLLGMGANCLAEPNRAWLPSLRRDSDGAWREMLEGLQKLYVDGEDVNWAAFDEGGGRSRSQIPTYPFRQIRHQLDLGAASADEPFEWTALASALDRQSQQAPLDLNAASYPEKWRALARVATEQAVAFFGEVGLFAEAGETRTLDDVLNAASVDPIYRRLIKRWLDRLVGAGLLRREGDAYAAVSALPQPALAAAWREAEALFRDNEQLLAYVKHCGELVNDVLRGRENPLETLFPGGSFELADDLYQRSATMRYINELAAAAVQCVAAQSKASLRILEIGAGTGSATASVAPRLPAGRTRFVFTDVSEFFLERAQRNFASYPFMEYRRFDLEHDLKSQGFAPGGFDVVVSANVVHAVKDLRAALRRLIELLAPGGVLILVESTTHFDWFDMSTGLFEGWQHFTDDLRIDNPLLGADQWVEALREAGFTQAAAWPRAGTSADHLGQHVVAAQAPGTHVAASLARRSFVEASVSVAAPAMADVREKLNNAIASQRSELLLAFVREKVMKVLRLGVDDIPERDARLMDLGFDSLMAVQLRNELGGGLQLERPLPPTLMFDYPTIASLTAHLQGILFPQVAESEIKTVEVYPDASIDAAAIAEMSDEDVERLLLDRLENI